MKKRDEILGKLTEEFDLWQDLLSTPSEQLITSSRLPNGWSIKDLMAHLMAWQQVTLARLEAAQRNSEPTFPDWLAGESPESEEHLHQFNDRILGTYRAQPWSRVHRDWRAGFVEVLKLAADLPDRDLMEPGRYPWLHGRPLIAVLHGLYEHHHVDHLGSLLAWMDDHQLRGPE